MLSADSGSVTLSWLPPLASGQSQDICNKCGADGTLTQYAINAEMGGTKKYETMSYDYGPEHATGTTVSRQSYRLRFHTSISIHSNYFILFHSK